MEDGGAQPLVAVWAWSLLSLLAGSSSGGCWLGTAQLHATVDRPQFGGHHQQHTLHHQPPPHTLTCTVGWVLPPSEGGWGPVTSAGANGHCDHNNGR